MPIRCSYRNQSTFPEIVRITERSCYLERVVFPGQQIVFEASAHSHLEIHTFEIVTAILEDKIPCQLLCCEN